VFGIKTFEQIPKPNVYYFRINSFCIKILMFESLCVVKATIWMFYHTDLLTKYRYTEFKYSFKPSKSSLHTVCLISLEDTHTHIFHPSPSVSSFFWATFCQLEQFFLSTTFAVIQDVDNASLEGQYQSFASLMEQRVAELFVLAGQQGTRFRRATTVGSYTVQVRNW